MVHIWFPKKKWRTDAWHIENAKFTQKGSMFIQYQPSYDTIGVETGQGHLMIWENWPSFRHGRPSENMSEREALKLMEQMEADCNNAYKRVNDRYYNSYRDLGDEYFDAKPFREHPQLVADRAVVLAQDAKSMRPLKFNASSGRNEKADKPPAPQRLLDDAAHPSMADPRAVRFWNRRFSGATLALRTDCGLWLPSSSPNCS